MLNCRAKIIRSAYALVETASRSKGSLSGGSNYTSTSSKKFDETEEAIKNASHDALESAKRDMKCASTECGDRGYSEEIHKPNQFPTNEAQRRSEEYFYRGPRDNEGAALYKQDFFNKAKQQGVEFKKKDDKNFTEEVAESAGNVWEKTKNLASDAWETTKDVASSAAESVKNAAIATKDKTKEVLSDSKEAVKENYHELKDNVKNSYHDHLGSGNSFSKERPYEASPIENASENLGRASRRAYDDVKDSSKEIYNKVDESIFQPKPNVGVDHAGDEALRNEKLMSNDPYQGEKIYNGRTLRSKVLYKDGIADKNNSNSSIVKDAKEKVGDAWESAKETASNAWEAAKEKVKGENKNEQYLKSKDLKDLPGQGEVTASWKDVKGKY